MERLRNENERLNRKKSFHLFHFNKKTEDDRVDLQKEMTYKDFQLKKEVALKQERMKQNVVLTLPHLNTTFPKLDIEKKQQRLAQKLKRQRRLAALLRQQELINQEISELEKELRLKKDLEEYEFKKSEEKREREHLQHHIERLQESFKFFITDDLK